MVSADSFLKISKKVSLIADVCLPGFHHAQLQYHTQIYTLTKWLWHETQTAVVMVTHDLREADTCDPSSLNR
jgi:hypothetical protein